MMSNSNYIIGLQRLKPVHTVYCGLHNLAENWSWAPDVNGRDRDVCFPRPRRDIDNFSRDETLVRLETETSRPRPQPCYDGIKYQRNTVNRLHGALLANCYTTDILCLSIYCNNLNVLCKYSTPR